jgi:hypothetical protein
MLLCTHCQEPACWGVGLDHITGEYGSELRPSQDAVDRRYSRTTQPAIPCKAQPIFHVHMLVGTLPVTKVVSVSAAGRAAIVSCTGGWK